MSGFRRGEGGGDGFGIAHLTNENYVRVLSEYKFEGVAETEGVGMDFALFDDCLFVGMYIFNGVFDGDDMAAALRVDTVDHGGKGGCLLYTSDAADEEDSVDLGGCRFMKKKKSCSDESYDSDSTAPKMCRLSCYIE
eukprot:TRINITY_DN2722_c0_g1_i1.p2 TRINITY_DN2722_c0_g1~~TRINITY_DN2722_c0_g1_i1.p2  ORF type:complete len:137 (+),score=20.99 TRINITY_DN2722_c0_g1_i1:428-838(+)